MRRKCCRALHDERKNIYTGERRTYLSDTGLHGNPRRLRIGVSRGDSCNRDRCRFLPPLHHHHTRSPSRSVDCRNTPQAYRTHTHTHTQTHTTHVRARAHGGLSPDRVAPSHWLAARVIRRRVNRRPPTLRPPVPRQFSTHRRQ